MNRPGHYFNIESAGHLFNALKAVAHRLAVSEDKRTEDFLLLVFGLVHLREWIAPDYDWGKSAPVKPEEHFYQDIWKFEEFKLLQGLCNRSKHMCATETAMGTLHKTTSGSRVVIGYFADGKDVEHVIRAVIQFYEDNWFKAIGASLTE